MTPPTFVRFNELKDQDINVEHHTHTIQTDGLHTIDEVIGIAEGRGLRSLAFTEHVRRDTDWFTEFANSITQAKPRHQALALYIGCEAKALNTQGGLDVSEDIHALCDIVLGSVHRFPGSEGGYADWSTMDDETFAQTEFELAAGLVDAAPIHVLAHPGGMFMRRRKKPFPLNLMRQLMEKTLERGIAIEINTSYQLGLDDFLALCEQVNPYVSIGSDAHKTEDFAQCRDILREKLGDRL